MALTASAVRRDPFELSGNYYGISMGPAGGQAMDLGRGGQALSLARRLPAAHWEQKVKDRTKRK